MELQVNDLLEILHNTKGQSVDSYRSDERFEQIKEMFDVANDPNASSNSINWQRICDLSYKMLAEGAKDILITNYFCIALLKTQGVTGLAKGLQVLDVVVVDHWQEMYPPVKRIAGRWAAIEWLTTELSLYLDKTTNNFSVADTEEVVKFLTSIDKNLTSVSKDPPNLLPLIKSFERVLEQAKATAAEEASQQQQQSVEPTVESFSTTAVREINSIADALARVAEINQELADISAYLITNDESTETQKLAYAIARFVLWNKVQSFPELDDEQKTKVPAPNSEELNQFKLLVSSANYDTLLELAQGWVQENPFWLDLHQEIYNGFVTKNQQSIANIIKAECMSFVCKYPQLKEAKFSDGTKMLSDEAYSWLVEDFSNSSSVTTMAIEASSDEFMDKINAVKAMSQAQRIDALIQIYNEYQSQISRYQKIKFYLSFVQELVSQQKTDLLNIYTDLLEEEFYYFNISELDKNMAVIVQQVLIKAKKVLNKDFYKNYKDLSKLDLAATIGISTDN